MTLRVALHGAGGRMGRAIIAALAGDREASLIAAVDPRRAGQDAYAVAQVEPPTGSGLPMVRALSEVTDPFDVVIDFSTRDATIDAARWCLARSAPLVVGTTGLSAETQESLDRLAQKTAVVVAPNMSIGVTVLFHLAREAARLLGPEYDAEIVEMHHRHKVDAPSGTASRLAEVIRQAKGLSDEALVFGRHGQVGSRSDGEVGVMTLRGGDVVGDHTLILAGPGERLELTHRAHDRSIFARGAVRAAKWAARAAPGRYDMADVVGVGGEWQPV